MCYIIHNIILTKIYSLFLNNKDLLLKKYISLQKNTYFLENLFTTHFSTIMTSF